MTDGEPLRVVIAEDSVLMREGIASLLEGAGFEIVEEYVPAVSPAGRQDREWMVSARLRAAAGSR